jgi:hypothetical protein
MKVRALALIVGLAGVATPVAANAQQLGTQSSGGFTFTVEIPPFAAALAASREGAVGLWTIEDAHGGLMLNLPSEVLDRTERPAAIFNGVNTVFSASMDPNALVELTEKETTISNGLRRRNLSFRRTAAVATGASAVTMVIAGV